jgi:hypothetical protein
MSAQNSANTVLATQHQRTQCSTQRFSPKNSQQHGKKCVFGVFLIYTTLARIAQSYVIDFTCKMVPGGGIEPPTRGFSMEAV